MRHLLNSILLCAALPVFAQDFVTHKGHGGPIMALAVSPSDVIVSASFDNSAGIWSNGNPIWLEGHDAAVTAITIGTDGRVISGGDDFAVFHWTGLTPNEIGRHKGKITSLAPSLDGAVVAAGSWDGDIVLWSLQEEAPLTLPYAGAGVNAVAYALDGSALFAATSKGVLLRYETKTYDTPRPLVRHGFGINRIAVGEGWIAYGAVDGGTRIVNSDTGQKLADFTLGRRPILALDYHQDTGQLAVGDGEGHIMIIDTDKWEISHDFRAMREGPVWALAFSNDGLVIHAGGLDNVIYAWPVALLDEFKPAEGSQRNFLLKAETMGNGERQFMRKCSICHSLTKQKDRRAGPTLYNVFGRRAGTVDGYRYSIALSGSDIIWTETTIKALFEVGPDFYTPGSKMPQQVIAKSSDRADLVTFLKQATQKGSEK